MSDDTPGTIIPLHGQRPARKPSAPASSTFDRAAYDRAARWQQDERHRSKTPIPARITIALDVAGLEGDDVDRMLGVWESPTGRWEPGTAVDRWENGTLTPTREEIRRLARATRVRPEFFYTPLDRDQWRVMVCERGRNGGLTVVTSSVDAHGVLHTTMDPDPDERADPQQALPLMPDPPVEDEIPTPGRAARPTRSRPVRSRPGQHVMIPDVEVPDHCVCGLPRRNPRHVPATPGVDAARRAAGDRDDEE